jgi:hypothetical protein
MPKMPASVRTSILLLSGAYIVGMAVALFDRRPLPRFPGDEDHFVFAAALGGSGLVVILFGALFLFIVQAVTRARNWARLALAAQLVLGAPYVFELPGNFAGVAAFPRIDACLWVIQCIGVALLFSPTSNQWYRSFRAKRGADE